MEYEYSDSQENSNPNLLDKRYVKELLNETRKWTRFLGIVGYVGCALLVLFGLAFMAFMDEMGSAFGERGLPTILLGIIYFVMAAVYYFPSDYLYKSSQYFKAALHQSDEQALINALEKQKSFYRYFGILVAILLGIYALIFLGGIAAGLSAL